MRIQCTHCKEIIETNPYFYNERITTTNNFLTMTNHYEGSLKCHWICACCGLENNTTVTAEIYPKDIASIVINKSLNEKGEIIINEMQTY